MLQGLRQQRLTEASLIQGKGGKGREKSHIQHTAYVLSFGLYNYTCYSSVDKMCAVISFNGALSAQLQR